jgi:hypothetical protein
LNQRNKQKKKHQQLMNATALGNKFRTKFHDLTTYIKKLLTLLPKTIINDIQLSILTKNE